MARDEAQGASTGARETQGEGDFPRFDVDPLYRMTPPAAPAPLAQPMAALAARKAAPVRPLDVVFVVDTQLLYHRIAELAHSHLQMIEGLVMAGHRVTVCLVGYARLRQRRLPRSLQQQFATLGIEILTAPEPDVPLTAGQVNNSVEPAYGIYEFFKQRRFDVAHFIDTRGHAYFCLLAKSLGLAFAGTTFCVHALGPKVWLDAAAFRHPRPSDMLIAHIERASLEMADYVFAPGREIVDWMHRHGYRLDASRLFQAPCIRPRWPGPAPLGDASQKISEIVFLGNFGFQAGLHLFCNAIERLARTGQEHPEVLFVAPYGRKFVGRRFIERWQRRTGGAYKVRIKDGLDEAGLARALSGRKQLVVVPAPIANDNWALGCCLAAGLRFLAVDTESARRQIDETDWGRVLVAAHPAPLAAKLEAAIKSGLEPAKPSAADSDPVDLWCAAHPQLAATQKHDSKASSAEEAPLVSVCITHFNRPRFLEQALESVRRQLYANIEVIIVDDGSHDPAALAALDKLERSFEGSNWRVVRQANRYLGAARNTAVAHANGKYILFLDDDNYAKADEISTFVDIAERTGADILTCFAEVFEGSGPPPEDGRASRRIAWIGPNVLFAVFANAYGDANAFVRSETYRALGGYSEDYGVGKDDMEFYTRAIMAGYRLQLVPEALFWYRISKQRMRNLHFSDDAGAFRILRPFRSHISPFAADVMLLSQALERERKSQRAVAYVRWVQDLHWLIDFLGGLWLYAKQRIRNR